MNTNSSRKIKFKLYILVHDTNMSLHQSNSQYNYYRLKEDMYKTHAHKNVDESNLKKTG